jgi:hypothetical protein
MATLDRLTFWLDVKGAEKVKKTLENIQKATYAETKSAISALLEPIRRKEREEKKAEALRKKRQKPLDQWNKEQVRFGERHARAAEKTLTAQMNAEQRVLYYKKRQAKLDNEFSKTRRQTREWYVARERQERNALDLARSQGRLERQNAAEKAKAYKEYLKTDSLSAYEKRQAIGADWVARKEANKEKGQARAVAIAQKRQKEQERATNNLNKAADKLARAAEKQKALADKQAKIRLDEVVRRSAQVAATVLKAPAAVYNAMKIFSARTSNALRAEAADYLAGGKAAQQYDVELARYGGTRGEGVSSIRSLSSSLGGLRYGDTSLIRAAGRFGIGGISPYDNPLAVKRKIISKLRTMPMNEAIYAAQQLGLTDAELRMALDTGASVGGVNARTRELGGSAMSRDIATQYALTNVGSTWLNEVMGGTPAAAFESLAPVLGGAIGATALYKGAKGIVRGGKSLGKIAGKVGGGSLLKTAGKMGGKSLLKKIPIAGAFIGAGLAIDRAMEGDWLGAGGEALSGLASTVPLYGTAASVGIDAALAARDLSRGASGSSAQSSGVSIGEHGEKTLHVPAIYADSIIIKRSQDITESAF